MTMMIRRSPWRTLMHNDDPALSGGCCTYRLPLDAYETDDAFVITASVPGLNPDDITINLEDDVLSIQGEFKNRIENVHYLIHERAAEGRFQRRLRLNVPIEADNVEAVFTNGILTLTLPKAPEARPLNIPIKKIEG